MFKTLLTVSKWNLTWSNSFLTASTEHLTMFREFLAKTKAAKISELIFAASA